MKIVAIIPARAGSKRLKNKNVFKFLGKPLIRWTIDTALKSDYISYDNLYISTDCHFVKSYTRDCWIIDRPKHLAEDHVWTQPVINHATEQIGDVADEDVVVILQANSPQMTPQIVDKCINMLIDNDLWQVHTVDSDFINNGAVQVMRRKVFEHAGKANYNGVVVTDWVDIHTLEDVQKVASIMEK